MFFDDRPSLKKRIVPRHKLLSLERNLTPPNFFDDHELLSLPAGDVFFYDVECYPNYFCVCFIHHKTGRATYVEITPDSPMNIDKLRFMVWHFCLVGFYSNDYDMPMCALAMRGLNASKLSFASMQLVEQGLRPFDIEREYKLTIPYKNNHIDLIEVAPLDGSLKLYAARLHCERMQDLPYDPHIALTREQAWEVLIYCFNDLKNTNLLYNELLPQIELREAMGREYGQDLRSRSDAQVAEAVLNSELAKLNGKAPKCPKLPDGLRFAYAVPPYVQYRAPALCAALSAIAGATFAVDGLGSPTWPEGLGTQEKNKAGKLVWTLKVKINDKVYKLGMGGLHSVEKCAKHVATEDMLLIDRDVASYYPRIILNQKLYPKHLGESFLTVYNKVVEQRLAAKAAGNKVVADSLKITINGSFGKLGNKYSTLYAPDLLLQVTITGQLCLLMLIEMIEDAGIEVVSANTDGIVIKCPKNRKEELDAIVSNWEQITQFETEEVQYLATYSKDVNNYIAVKKRYDKQTKTWLDEIEECKTKGVYSERGSALNSVLSKNPENLICSDAITKLIQFGTPIEKTITECKDFRRFVSVKRVKGGGHKDGVLLGKVVRWYYAKNVTGQIHYIDSGNAVGKTEGAKPVMDLPPSFPTDIDYDWYINETNAMLYDIGFYDKPQQTLF